MSIRQINITAEQPPIDLYIGRVAENEVTGVEFDLTPWIQTYGEGAATIVMKRWGDSDPYPIALEIDENGKAVWMFSAADLAKPGYAYAQLSFETATEKRKKSPIYTLKIGKSLIATGEQPDPYDSWLEALQHIAAKAMAEALDIDGIETDDTLSIEGGIADAKAAGDALALKADKSTTYTKTEVDQMIEDVEVETDTTLEVEGAAADAAETGRQIGLLKADLGDLTELETETKTDLVSAINEAKKSGLSEDVKDALIECFMHIGAWTDGDRDEYISNLEMAMSGDALFVTFDAGYTVSVQSSATPSEEHYNDRLCLRMITTARACTQKPIKNKGYTFTVTDSTKYQLVARGVVDMTPIALKSNPTFADEYGYLSDGILKDWVSSDTTDTEYVWLALKKNDGSEFTQQELANSAAAVVTIQTA